MSGPRRRLRDRWVRPVPLLAGCLLAAAFAGWEGVQGRFSTASHASVLTTIAVVLLLALVSGRGRQRTRSAAWARRALRGLRAPLSAARLQTAAVAGALVWVLLIAATIGWDVTSFVKQRHDLPTLSRLFGDVTDHDWGRALVFAAWIVLGLYLATGWRRPPSGEPGSGLGQPSPSTQPHPRRSPPDDQEVT